MLGKGRVAAVVSLGTLLLASFAFAQPPKRSEEAERLVEEYYRLARSIEQPEKWREAVAQRKEFLAKLQDALKGRPELADEVGKFVARTEQSIAFDGVDILGANAPRSARTPEPFGKELDVVSWIEDDHLRVAVGNPAEAPRKVGLSLRQWLPRKEIDEWPSVAGTTIEVTGREVVIAHFDGIPTTGEKEESSWIFAPRIALIENDKEVKGAGLFVQNAGGWGGTTSSIVARAGEIQIAVPTFAGRQDVRGFTLYVPREARCRARELVLALSPADRAGIVEAEHGYFVRNSVLRLKLNLPEADEYDIVAVPDLCAKFAAGSLVMEDREFGPRVLQLGKNTRVRRVTVALPEKNRLDAKPLSEDPVERTAQLALRFRTDLWNVRENAERQIAAIGKPAIPKVIELLRSERDNYKAHLGASGVLTKMGEQAVDSLVALLHEKGGYCRGDAAEILGKMGGAGVDALLREVKDGDPEARAHAARGLAGSSDPRRRDAIMELMKDPDGTVRAVAASQLGRMGADDATVLALAEKLKDPSAAARREAIHALAQLSAKAYSLEIAALLKDSDQSVRQAALYALARFKDPRTVPALCEAALDNDRNFRRTVAWAFWNMADERALPTLVMLLADADESVRESAVVALADAKSEVAVQYAIRALDDPSPRVRRAAARTVERMGYKVDLLQGQDEYRLAPPETTAPLPREAVALVECLADGNYHRRVAARDELAKLGEKAIEPLTEAIADGRLLVRLSAAETLGRMDLPAARERLKALLASEEKLLAYCAADALACLRDEDIAGMWTKLLSSEDFYLRAAAAEALGRTRRGEFAAALMARLDDPRAEVRRKAIWALGEIRAPASVDALFERFVNRRGGLRSAKEVYASYQEYMLDVDELRDALVKIGPPAVSRLIPAVEYGWSPLQEKAQEALVKIGAPAVEPLIKALDSPEPDTKSAAAKVLSRLRPPEAIGPLISHTGGTSFVEAEAFRALAAYGEVARGKLEQALADPKLNLLAKASAGALLVNLEDRSGLVFLEDVVRGGTAQEMNSIVGLMGVLRRREFLPLIGEALERPDAWQGVTYAAAYCGGVEALPMLQKARNHANEGVRTGAEDWVRRLAPPGR